MDESIDITKLTKLFSHIMKSKIDVQFTDEEVKEFNEDVHNKNTSSIIQLFESKEAICYEVSKNTIHDKIDSLWQFIMDQSYDKWKHDGMRREEFLEQLTEYEKLAVMFGNFNYQVENGGLSQWDDNGYSEDLDFLYDFLDNCDYSRKDKFLLILDEFSCVKTAIEELDHNNDWYEEDCQTRLKSLTYYDKDYYEIKDSWNDYFENYLIDNIPNEYMDKVLSINEEIKI